MNILVGLLLLVVGFVATLQSIKNLNHASELFSPFELIGGIFGLISGIVLLGGTFL